MEKITKNNKIKNNTKYVKYYKVLKTSNWNPAKINLVSGDTFFNIVLANLAAAGYSTSATELKNLSQEETIQTLPDTLIKLGFEKLTDEKFLTSEEYLQHGDILFGEEDIIAINLNSVEKKKKEAPKKIKVEKLEEPVKKVEIETVTLPAPVIKDLSVAAKYSQESYKGVWTTKAKAQLKQDADFHSSLIASIPKGSLVTSEGQYNLFGSQIWLKINYKGYLGYCNLGYLTR